MEGKRNLEGTYLLKCSHAEFVEDFEPCVQEFGRSKQRYARIDEMLLRIVHKDTTGMPILLACNGKVCELEFFGRVLISPPMTNSR
jgi:hypothetical protein